MFRESSLPKLKRIGCGLVGAILISFGLHFFRADYAFSYRNWFGGLVFAPIVTLLGMVALLGAVFNWLKIWDSPPPVPRRK
jgi:hypothetical protein